MNCINILYFCFLISILCRPLCKIVFISISLLEIKIIYYIDFNKLFIIELFTFFVKNVYVHGTQLKCLCRRLPLVYFLFYFILL